jgi:hypothetical protein
MTSDVTLEKPKKPEKIGTCDVVTATSTAVCRKHEDRPEMPDNHEMKWMTQKNSLNEYRMWNKKGVSPVS